MQELKQREIEAKNEAKEKKSETKGGGDLLDLDGIEEPVATEEQDPEPPKQSILDSIFDNLAATGDSDINLRTTETGEGGIGLETNLNTESKEE